MSHSLSCIASGLDLFKGGIVLILATARVLLFHMHHSPKWLVTVNRDDEAIKVLQEIAQKHNRPMTLTVEELEAEGEILAKVSGISVLLRSLLTHRIRTSPSFAASSETFATFFQRQNKHMPHRLVCQPY